MKCNNIFKALDKADNLRIKTESQYVNVLNEIIPFFDFEIDSQVDGLREYFHVEYQPSDGIVVGDNDSMVYSMIAITNYIQEKGKFKSLDDLINNCSI